MVDETYVTSFFTRKDQYISTSAAISSTSSIQTFPLLSQPPSQSPSRSPLELHSPPPSQPLSPSLRGPCGRHRRTECVALFDHSGLSLQPWAAAGYDCHCYDLINTNEVRDGIHFWQADLDDPSTLRRIVEFHRGDAYFASAFPPCTDLALSGSRWWAAKRAANPLFQHQAAARALKAARAAAEMSLIWYIENPIGALCSLWRSPNFTFQPYEYGGYLPRDDVHPIMPDRVAARDAYPKRTCIWCSKTFRKPPRKPVPPIFLLYRNAKSGRLNRYAIQHAISRGGKAKCAGVRSLTPRGWSTAVFLANKTSF